MRPEALPCALCGQEDDSVAVGIVAWAEPGEGPRYESVARCPDRLACRLRVEGQGRRWPIAAGPPRTPNPLTARSDPAYDLLGKAESVGDQRWR